MENKMNYQLVLQFPSDSQEDFNLLIEMENKLEEMINSKSDVDGHDFGSNEMNIFIYSSEPKECFEQAVSLLKGMTDMSLMKAAYRHVESEDFTILWPKELATFAIK